MAAIGTIAKSDGAAITPIEWRANRLVDAFAKKAATGQRLPANVRNLLAVAEAAVESALAQLGVVTFEANNFPFCENKEDGSSV